MVATAREQLDAINHRIHDRWFSVNDITYDSSTGRWTLLYSDNDHLERRRLDSARNTKATWLLIVDHVTHFEIVDSQRVVWYDLNQLRYYARQKVLRVTTNIPLLIRLRVSLLHISIAKGV